MDYPFWLVTRGRAPQSCRGRDRLLPLALVPKDDGLRALSIQVADALRSCAMAYAPASPSPMQVLQGLSSEWLVRAMADLWLSEVRLDDEDSAIANETAIEWVLFRDRQGRLPPEWQGPADRVIRPALPFTIRSARPPSPFLVEVTMPETA